MRNIRDGGVGCSNTDFATNLEGDGDGDCVSDDGRFCEWKYTFVAGELEPDLEAVEIESVCHSGGD